MTPSTHNFNMSDALLSAFPSLSTDSSPFNWTLITSLQNTSLTSLSDMVITSEEVIPYELLKIIVSVSKAFTITSSHSSGNGYLNLFGRSCALFYNTTTVQPQTLGTYFLLRNNDYSSFDGSRSTVCVYHSLTLGDTMNFTVYKEISNSGAVILSTSRITQFSCIGCIQVDVYGANNFG